jgi:hypothetical protein
MKRRIIGGLTALALALAIFIPNTLAVDKNKHFDFTISVNGGETAATTIGAIVTVRVKLKQSNSETITLYALHDKIIFDTNFFELVPGSLKVGDNAAGMTCGTDEQTGSWSDWTGVTSGAFAAGIDGNTYGNPIMLVTFQLRALKLGTSVILHREHTMSTTTGMDEYESSANNATVVIKKSESFSDVPKSSKYYDAVQHVVSANLFMGTGNGKFSPDVAMSRAMFVTVLGRFAKIDTSKYTGSTFSDVKAGAWYAPYVAWAHENKIITGSNGKFSPNASVTREQAAVIMYRYAEFVGDNVSASSDLSAFSDSDKVSEYAKPALAWAIKTKIITDADGALAPQEVATRALVASVFYNYSKQ